MGILIVGAMVGSQISITATESGRCLFHVAGQVRSIQSLMKPSQRKIPADDVLCSCLGPAPRAISTSKEVRAVP